MNFTIAQLQEKTTQIEAEKKQKQLKRSQRLKKRVQLKRRQVWEKLVAPIMLIVTIIISLMIKWLT